MPKQVKCPACNHEFSASHEASLDDCAEKDVDRTDGDASTTSFDNSDLRFTDKALSHQARRHRQRPLARAAKWIVFIVSLAVCIVAGLLAVKLGSKVRLWGSMQMETPSATTPTEDDVDRSVESSDTKTDWSRIVKLSERSIVEVRSSGNSGEQSLGCGFLIDRAGHVATNYHVVSEATQGFVRFKDGTTCKIEGYAAIEPTRDLVILKVEDLPQSLLPLALATVTEPEPQGEVIAIGHPFGLEFSPFEGRVSRTLNTSQLPKHSREFLAKRMDGDANQLWIQHTATLSVGNSGGPLLNDQGEVIGVNTWTDKTTGFGYALSVNQLLRMAKELLPEVEPLKNYAKDSSRITAEIQRLSADQINQLYDQIEELNWAPQSREDYQMFQQLARAMTVARFPESYGLNTESNNELLERLILTADSIELRLRENRWKAFDQVTLVNEQALRQVEQASTAVFCFATVLRAVEGDDGSRAVLMQLAGTEKTLFIPLGGTLLDPEPNTHCLVLGINQNGQQVQYGENPLKPNFAPIIVSRTIIPIVE